MTVTKILEQTLSAGSTSVSFTDSDIPNSLIRVYSSNSELIPISRMLSGNTLTVTYEAQTNNIDVAVEIVKQGLDIVDNIISEDTDKALSAKQGKLLKDDIDDITNNIDTLSNNLDTLSDNLDTLSGRVDNLDIPVNITDLDDVTVTNIQSGQVLAWDGTKFVNVNQSGGSFPDFSTTEVNTGIKWIDGKPIYRKTFQTTSPSTANSATVVQDVTSLNIDTVVNISGNLGTIPMNWYLDLNSHVTTWVNGVKTGIVMNVGSSSVNTSCNITIEYTKSV